MRILIEMTVDETRAAILSGALDELALCIREDRSKRAEIEDLLKSKEDTYRLRTPKAKTPAPQEEPEAEAPKDLEPAPEAPPWEEPEVMPEPKREVTKEMVREVLGELQKAGRKAEIQELLAKYGVKKFTDVDPSDYASLLTEAEKL